MSRKRTFVALIAASASLALAFGPCSSDEKKKLTDEEFLFAAQTAANASVLRIDDMPAGWQVEIEEPDEEEEETESQFTGECAEFDADREGWPGEVARAEADSLNGPTHEINSVASVYRDAAEADRVLTSFFDLAERCRDQILAVARSESGPDATYDFTFIEDLDAGDTARGVRVEFSDPESTGVVDFLYIRQGRMILSFVHGGDETDDEERATFLAMFLEKAATAEEALPQ